MGFEGERGSPLILAKKMAISTEILALKNIFKLKNVL